MSASDPPDEMPAADRRLWERAGARFDDPEVVERADRSGRAAMDDLVRRSRTPDQVAAYFGPEAAAALEAAGELYSFTHEGERLFPVWQFDSDRGLLPGLARVLRALDPTLHPLTVDHWMTHPNLELTIAGDATTPVAWLARDVDPGRVTELVAQL